MNARVRTAFVVGLTLVAACGKAHDRPKPSDRPAPPPRPKEAAYAWTRGPQGETWPGSQLIVDNSTGDALDFQLDRGDRHSQIHVPPGELVGISIPTEDSTPVTIAMKVGGEALDPFTLPIADPPVWLMFDVGARWSYRVLHAHYSMFGVPGAPPTHLPPAVLFEIERITDFMAEPPEKGPDGQERTALLHDGDASQRTCRRAASTWVCPDGDTIYVQKMGEIAHGVATVAVDSNAAAPATIALDGVEVGEVAAGAIVWLSFPKGEHTLVLTAGGAELERVKHDFAAGAPYILNPGGRRTYTMEWRHYGAVIPDLYGRAPRQPAPVHFAGVTLLHPGTEYVFKPFPEKVAVAGYRVMADASRVERGKVGGAPRSLAGSLAALRKLAERKLAPTALRGFEASLPEIVPEKAGPCDLYLVTVLMSRAGLDRDALYDPWQPYGAVCD